MKKIKLQYMKCLILLGLLLMYASACKQTVKFSEMPKIPLEPVRKVNEASVPDPISAPITQSVADLRYCEQEVSVPKGFLDGKIVASLMNKCVTQLSVDNHLPTRTVDIFFLIDVSGSMQKNIDSIRNNLSRFVSKIKDLSPRIGIIPFVDQINTEDIVPLTFDVERFLSGLHRLKASGGGRYDYQEAGLLAIETAVSMFSKDFDHSLGRINSDKIMLMITNSPSHRGDSADLTIDHTVTRLNDFVGIAKAFQLYYSIPTFDNEVTDKATGSRIAAHVQYQSILRGINPRVPLGERGGILSYPFSSETLLSEFSGMITKVAPRTISGDCIVNAVTVVERPTERRIDSGLTLSNSLDRYLKNQEYIEFSVPSQINLATGTWWLDVNRCCGTKAELSQFTCNKYLNQKIVMGQ